VPGFARSNELIVMAQENRTRCLAILLFGALLLGPISSLQAQNGDPIDVLAEQESNTGVSSADLKTFSFEPEIIGPSARPIYLPEVVLISYSIGANRRAICTGTLINEQMVLTAGHCSCAARQTYTVIIAASESGTTGPALVDRLIRFPRYDCRAPHLPQPGKDLALLKLDRKFPRTARNKVVSPFAIPNQSNLRRLLIAGYGRDPSGQFPNRLLGAFSPILDLYCVRSAIRGSYCDPFGEFALSALVSATRPGADTCDGDSGGPVYWFPPTEGDKNNVISNRRLIGVTSRGLRGVPQFGPTGCGGGGIYTSLGSPEVLAWLGVNGVAIDFYAQDAETD
jgi:hypothetical protein